MAADTTLTLQETIVLLDARLKNVELYLSATIPGFNADMDGVAADQINTSSLVAASKTKLISSITTYKATLPKYK